MGSTRVARWAGKKHANIATTLSEIRATRPEFLEAIRAAGEISPEVEKGLGEFLDGFVRTFA